MEKILVSACLLGDKVNYEGKGNYTKDIEKIKELYDIVPFCPECEGGLKIPRAKNEIRDGRVFNIAGKDVTENFLLGAKKALNICKYLHIKVAILKENSPSCGVHKIYNGKFNKIKIDGVGITTKTLLENGIKVYSEDEIDELIARKNGR